MIFPETQNGQFFTYVIQVRNFSSAITLEIVSFLFVRRYYFINFSIQLKFPKMKNGHLFLMYYSRNELLQCSNLKIAFFSFVIIYFFAWRKKWLLLPRGLCVHVQFYSAWTHARTLLTWLLSITWFQTLLTVPRTTLSLRVLDYCRRHDSWRPPASSIKCGNTTTAHCYFISLYAQTSRNSLTTASTSTLG